MIHVEIVIVYHTNVIGGTDCEGKFYSGSLPGDMQDHITERPPEKQKSSYPLEKRTASIFYPDVRGAIRTQDGATVLSVAL